MNRTLKVIFCIFFFAETIDSYTGNPMSDDEIKLAADAIENLAKTAASKGARFLFAPAPDKNTIYPEKCRRDT